MKPQNEKFKLVEHPEITNFVYWANPDTFQRYGSQFSVEGELVVWSKNRTKKYIARLYVEPKKEPGSDDFETLFQSEWKNWNFEIPEYIVKIENNQLVVRKAPSIRTAISIPEELYQKIEKAAKKESRSVAGLIRYILEKNF